MQPENDSKAAAGELRGLFRRELAPDRRTLRSVLERMDTQPGPLSRTDAHHGVRIHEHELTAREDSGSWRFIAIRNEVICVLTQCDFATRRREVARDEGFAEFHYLLEGPVRLAPEGASANRLARGATFLACHLSQGMSYTVDCEPGAHRKIALYVPTALVASALDLAPGSPAASFVEPEAGTMSILELPSVLPMLDCCRDLMNLSREARSTPLLAMAKVYELLARSLEVLQQRLGPETPALAISRRDLDLFARAREELSSNLDRPITAQSLARLIGTNPTKLKAGFKLVYGATLFEHRTQVRMRHALGLLTTTSMQVSEVSRAVGYRHQGSFTKVFKDHFGVLPRSTRSAGLSAEGSAPALPQQ